MYSQAKSITPFCKAWLTQLSKPAMSYSAATDGSTNHCTRLARVQNPVLNLMAQQAKVMLEDGGNSGESRIIARMLSSAMRSAIVRVICSMLHYRSII